MTNAGRGHTFALCTLALVRASTPGSRRPTQASIAETIATRGSAGNIWDAGLPQVAIP
jgi:hypothetical protein